MHDEWPVRWDLLLRYRLIETIAYWEGRLTTNHLTQAFGIQRNSASRCINTYLTDFAPGNLIYDKHLKGYKPSRNFQPRFTQGNANEYLQWLTHNSELISTFNLSFLHTPNIAWVDAPAREVVPDVLRKIVQAARNQFRFEAEYVSFNHPDPEIRVIAPHTLVFDGNRWHVRAWCEFNKEFRDFVLNRFRGVPDIIEDITDHPADKDEAWNAQVEIVIEPDSRLTPEQQDIVRRDYLMENGRLEISTRAALTTYVLQHLKLDRPMLEEDPCAQQIVLVNRKELMPWLFTG